MRLNQIHRFILLSSLVHPIGFQEPNGSHQWSETIFCCDLDVVFFLLRRYPVLWEFFWPKIAFIHHANVPPSSLPVNAMVRQRCSEETWIRRAIFGDSCANVPCHFQRLRHAWNTRDFRSSLPIAATMEDLSTFNAHFGWLTSKKSTNVRMRMIFLNSQNHISMAASLQQFSILSWSSMWFPPNKLTPPHESPLPSLGWRKRPVPLGQASAEAVSGNLQIEWAEMSYH